MTYKKNYRYIISIKAFKLDSNNVELQIYDTAGGISNNIIYNATKN
jgi:hypothetical protein